VKHEHESDLARVLDVTPPEAFERGAEGKRSWWRRALDLFATFRRKHGDALTREDIAEYRRQKEREELPVTDPERHLGLRVSRLEDMAKGLVVDGDSELNDLGNAEVREQEEGGSPNSGYSILSQREARTHERPNHLRLFQEGWEPRSRTATRKMTTSPGCARWSGATSMRPRSFLVAGTRRRRKPATTVRSGRGPAEDFFAESGGIHCLKRDKG
jgi:hypothetical protein